MISPHQPTRSAPTPAQPVVSLRLLSLILLLAAIGLATAPFAAEARQAWIDSRPPPTTVAAPIVPPTSTTAPTAAPTPVPTTAPTPIGFTETLTFVPDDLPGELDVVLLQDETSSFDDDMANIQTQLVPALTQAGGSSDIRFGLAGFQDRTLLSTPYEKYVELTDDFPRIQAAVDRLGGGSIFNNDAPEMSLNALEQALTDFDFRSSAQKVVVLSTDASSRNQSAQRIADVVERYDRAGVRLVVLRPPDASIHGPDRRAYLELVDGLTSWPGGSVIDLQDTSANLGDALLAGIRSPTFSARPSVSSGCPLASAPTFAPDPIVGTSDGTEVDFQISYEALPDDIGTDCVIDVGEGSRVDFTIGN